MFFRRKPEPQPFPAAEVPAPDVSRLPENVTRAVAWLLIVVGGIYVYEMICEDRVEPLVLLLFVAAAPLFCLADAMSSIRELRREIFRVQKQNLELARRIEQHPDSNGQ